MWTWFTEWLDTFFENLWGRFSDWLELLHSFWNFIIYHIQYMTYSWPDPRLILFFTTSDKSTRLEVQRKHHRCHSGAIDQHTSMYLNGAMSAYTNWASSFLPCKMDGGAHIFGSTSWLVDPSPVYLTALFISQRSQLATGLLSQSLRA